MEFQQQPTQVPLLVADLSRVEPVWIRVGGPRFFRRLAQALRAKGLTLYQAVGREDFYLYWRTFYAALRRRRHEPSRIGRPVLYTLTIEDTLRICRALGLNLAWLLLGVGPMWVDGRQEVVPPPPDEPWPSAEDLGVRPRPPWWPRVYYTGAEPEYVRLVITERGYGPLPEELVEWLGREFGAVRETPTRFRIPVPPEVVERVLRRRRGRPPHEQVARRPVALRAFAEQIVKKVREKFWEAYRPKNGDAPADR